MIYLELFYTFFIIGAFTFGGGYSMLSLIQNEVVVEHEWISAQQFTEIVAISQMTPGPIGINSATYIGYSVTGNVFGREMKESGTSHACRMVGGVRFRRMTFAAPPRGWWKELRHEPKASR